MYVYICADFCSIVFVHGLNGHPQKTWTYQGPKRDTPQIRSLEEGADSPSHTEEGSEADQGERTNSFLRHLKIPIAQFRSNRSRSKGKLKEQIHPQGTDTNREYGIKAEASYEAGAGKAAAKKSVFFWPQNLPQACMHSARVMTFGYDSNVSNFFGGAANQNTFYHHAGDLLGALVRQRQNAVCNIVTYYNSI